MNVVDPLLAHARRTPSRAAVVFPGGALTWAQLDGALRSGAHHLRARGIAPGARVGLTMRHPLVGLVASLALARIGAVQVALPESDPLPLRRECAEFLRLTHVVADSPHADLAGLAHVEFDRHGRYALVSVWEDQGALIVYDAKTLQEVKRIPMRKPSGKYNVFNKITFSEGTSH